MRAVATVYGREREAERPLLLGTVKTNIGHLEAAAGVAGLVKVLLAMRHGVIPKHLHFKNPNPHVEWAELPVRVTAEETAWPPASGRQPTAGISAFGISGTNAHLIVEGRSATGDDSTGNGVNRSPVGSLKRVPIRLPEFLKDMKLAEDGYRPRRVRLLPLSGKSSDALKELADLYLGWLDEHAEDLLSGDNWGTSLLADMAWTAATGRSHLEHRAGVVFEDALTLREGLARVTDDGGIVTSQRRGKLAFIFSGEAGDWVGCGQVLYESEPVARAVIERCDAALRAERGMSLLDAISGHAEAADDPSLVQAATYALQCAVTVLWSSLGISPGAVCASGVGEIAAAQVAGVFDLEAGTLLGARRGELAEADCGDLATGEVDTFLKDLSFAPARKPLLDGTTGPIDPAGGDSGQIGLERRRIPSCGFVRNAGNARGSGGDDFGGDRSRWRKRPCSIGGTGV